MSEPNPFETELFTAQYTPMLELLLQQKVSKLRGLVASGSHVGKLASPIQQISPLEFKQPIGRYAPIQFQIAQYQRRWVQPNDRDLPIPVDTFDLLKSIVDPKSGITEAVVAAANRFFDDVVIAAPFAASLVGVDQSANAGNLNSETWPATTYLVADTFDSASSVGMTYAKIVEGRRILEHYQNDLDAETVTLVESSQQNSDLLKQMEVVSSELRNGTSLSNGRVRTVLDTQVVHSERLHSNAATKLRNCIMFVRSGLYLGIWKDMDVRVDERKDLTWHPWQLYSMISAGATRTQLGKVIQINCADTNGADPTAP